MLWVRVELLDYMVTVKNKKERKTMFVYEIRKQRNNGRERYYVMWP